MDPRFAQLPASLRAHAKAVNLGGVPALLAHPDPKWAEPGHIATPAPVMVWMHGRTVTKELDPGRYLRWVRAGIAACALDLPGHGERPGESLHGSDRTLEVVEQMAGEIDGVMAALADRGGMFDVSRAGIGGMSAGGMATVIRLCTPHRFVVAAVESTAGNFEAMEHFGAFFTSGGRDPAGARARRLSPIGHVDAWRPIPLLALHSEADEWVPVSAIRSFTDRLSERYAAAGADPELVRLHTWPKTGAPSEHAGFGRVATEAKDLQTQWLTRWLQPTPADGAGAIVRA